MLATGGLDVVARPAVFHAEIRLELSVVVNRGEDFDRAQAIERDRLIGRDDESHGASGAGAELGILADFHVERRFLPRPWFELRLVFAVPRADRASSRRASRARFAEVGIMCAQ